MIKTPYWCLDCYKESPLMYFLSSLESQTKLSSLVNETELHDILKMIYSLTTRSILEEIPATVKRIYKILLKLRALINQFLDYPTDSAGSLMTIDSLI